jgi:hypothetical protein
LAGISFLAPAAAELVSAIGAFLWALTKLVIMTQALVIARIFLILYNYCLKKIYKVFAFFTMSLEITRISTH